MGLLSAIELPHWLMIGGAILVVMGFLGLAFTRNGEVATNSESPPEPLSKMPPLPRLLDSSRHKGESKLPTNGPASSSLRKTVEARRREDEKGESDDRE